MELCQKEEEIKNLGNRSKSFLFSLNKLLNYRTKHEY